MAKTASEYITAGIILSPHGVRGELAVRPETDFPERFNPGATVYIDGHPYVVEGAKWRLDRVILKLDDIDGAEAAKALRGKSLMIPRDVLEPLPSGSYYHVQLIGLLVRTTAGETLGKLTRIMATGANDVYVVSGEGGEVLLPATEEVVRKVDLEAGIMEIEPLPGLLELNR